MRKNVDLISELMYNCNVIDCKYRDSTDNQHDRKETEVYHGCA